MSIRLEVLESTLEHVQLDYELNKKHMSASVRLDTRNLTKHEIMLLCKVLGLQPLTEWYPKVMRELVLFEKFLLKTDLHVNAVRASFSKLYLDITGHGLDEAWWSDKNNRPKLRGKHAKLWAKSILSVCESKAATMNFNDI